MNKNDTLSIFACKEDNMPDNSNTITDCLQAIQDDFRTIVEPVRNANDPVKYKEAKGKLPAITWSGVFEHGRDLNALQYYNNSICNLFR